MPKLSGVARFATAPHARVKKPPCTSRPKKILAPGPELCGALRRRARRAWRSRRIPTATETASRHRARPAPPPRRSQGDADAPTAAGRHADLDADARLAHADGHAHGLLHALQHAGAAHALSLARGDRGRHAHARRHGHARRAGPGPVQGRHASAASAATARAGTGRDRRPGLPRRQEVEASRRRGRRSSASVQDSTSTTASECDLLDSKAPEDVLAGDTPRATERADGTPTVANPTTSARRPRGGPDRRPELLHREVPHPALPAPRSTRPPASSTACGGRSWRRSTRSRPTTGATSTSRAPARSGGCSSCPSSWKAVRRRRQRGRPQGPLQPGRRDLRRRALPARRQRRRGPAPRDVRLQPRRLVRGLRPDAARAHRRPAGRARRVADRPDPGPLPGPRAGRYAGDLRARGAAAPSAARTPRTSSRGGAPAARSTSTPARRAGGRRQRRPGGQASARPSGSAATSGCGTATATRTPTRTSAGSPTTYPAPEAGQADQGADRQGARAP